MNYIVTPIIILSIAVIGCRKQNKNQHEPTPPPSLNPAIVNPIPNNPNPSVQSTEKEDCLKHYSRVWIESERYLRKRDNNRN